MEELDEDTGLYYSPSPNHNMVPIFVFKISFYHNFSNTHLPAKGMTAELFEELEIQVGGQNLGLIMK